MDLSLLSQLLTSFNSHEFTSIISTMGQRNHLSNLSFIYVINIISTTGFTLCFLSVSLIIARSIKPSSVLHKLGFIFPIIIISIALLDITASILFISVAGNPNIISHLIVCTIDSFYIIRLVLLYLTVIWILFSGLYLAIVKIRSKRNH